MVISSTPPDQTGGLAMSQVTREEFFLGWTTSRILALILR